MKWNFTRGANGISDKLDDSNVAEIFLFAITHHVREFLSSRRDRSYRGRPNKRDGKGSKNLGHRNNETDGRGRKSWRRMYVRRVQRAAVLSRRLFIPPFVRTKKRTSFSLFPLNVFSSFFRPHNADNKETNGPPVHASCLRVWDARSWARLRFSPRENLTRPPRLKWTMNLGDEVPWIYTYTFRSWESRWSASPPPIRISFNSFRGFAQFNAIFHGDINASYILTNYSNYET